MVQADAHKLPVSNSCVDRVTCRCGIMFFTYVDLALAEMLRVLKPGGRTAFLAWGQFFTRRPSKWIRLDTGVLLRLP